MVDRINLILKAKNITAKQFAEEIGIQPSGMSHILGGRNNPSLDFVAKVLRRYPEIDANWLLLGRGEMYGGGVAQPVTSGGGGLPKEPEPQVAEAEKRPYAMHEPSLFDDSVEADEPLFKVEEPSMDQHIVEVQRSMHTPVREQPEYAPSYVAVPPDEAAAVVGDEKRRVQRMLLIYSDNTFEEYTPRR